MKNKFTQSEKELIEWLENKVTLHYFGHFKIFTIQDATELIVKFEQTNEATFLPKSVKKITPKIKELIMESHRFIQEKERRETELYRAIHNSFTTQELDYLSS